MRLVFYLDIAIGMDLSDADAALLEDMHREVLTLLSIAPAMSGGAQ
jgi:hypothetical protein